MRSTWLPLGLALVFPATGLLAGCGPDSDTTTSTSGTTTSTTEGGGGTSTTAAGGTAGNGGTGGTAGSSVGGGGTGGFMPPANDTCPGEKVTLALGQSKTLNGTLNGAADDYTTFCADTDPEPGAPDVVYQIDVPAAATVTLDVLGTGFIAALSLRKLACIERNGGDPCLNLGAAGTKVTLALDAGSYWVVVDSADGNAGNFTLDVTMAAPACGDGALNPTEQCDPGVASPDDGCVNPGEPNACKFGEPPPDPAILQCPGGLITVAKDDPLQLGPYNNGPGNHDHLNVTDDTACTSPAEGPENVFRVLPKADGTLTIEIGHGEDGTSLYCSPPPPAPPPNCADFVMYLRKGACNSNVVADQLGCADYTIDPVTMAFSEVLTITTPVTKDTDYWLVVDGLDDTFGIGEYYLQLSLK